MLRYPSRHGGPWSNQSLSANLDFVEYSCCFAFRTRLPRCHNYRHRACLVNTSQATYRRSQKASFQITKSRASAVDAVEGARLRSVLFAANSGPQDGLCILINAQCDEGQPACQGCVRHGVACIYDRRLALGQETPRPQQQDSATDVGHEALDDPVQEQQDPPETPQRRKLELVLMHHWREAAASSISVDETSVRMFRNEASKLALTSDAVLYMIHALAALHIERVGAPDIRDMVVNLGFTAEGIHRRYFVMSLREQLHDIASTDLESMEATTVTSMMLRVYVFASLQQRGRSLQPYQPPREWLRTSRSTLHIYGESIRISRQGDRSVAGGIILRFLEADSVVRGQIDGLQYVHVHGKLTEIFERLVEGIGEEEIEEFNNIAQRSMASVTELRDVYSRTLRYLNEALGMRGAEQEPTRQMLRKLTLFPVFADLAFVDLVNAGQPRALVVLAHYFALLISYSHIWWIGGSGRREVLSIADELEGTPWRAKMDWPLSVVSNPSWMSWEESRDQQ